MNTHAPNGFIAGGLILSGALEKGGTASKGFLIQPPDLRGASVTTLNAYQDNIRGLLASLRDNMRAQFQWSCDSDYRQELTQYYRTTQEVEQPQVRQFRTERFDRHWAKMHRRVLGRERLVMFISTRIGCLATARVHGSHLSFLRGARAAAMFHWSAASLAPR